MVIVLVSTVFPKRLPYDASGVPVNDDAISLHCVTGAGRRHDDIADSDGITPMTPSGRCDEWSASCGSSVRRTPGFVAYTPATDSFCSVRAVINPKDLFVDVIGRAFSPA